MGHGTSTPDLVSSYFSPWRPLDGTKPGRQWMCSYLSTLTRRILITRSGSRGHLAPHSAFYMAAKKLRWYDINQPLLITWDLSFQSQPACWCFILHIIWTGIAFRNLRIGHTSILWRTHANNALLECRFKRWKNGSEHRSRWRCLLAQTMFSSSRSSSYRILMIETASKQLVRKSKRKKMQQSAVPLNIRALKLEDCFQGTFTCWRPDPTPTLQRESLALGNLLKKSNPGASRVTSKFTL